MKTLESGAARLGLALGAEQLRAFELYERLLLAANEKMNLTAITDPEEVRVKHFLDSLTPLVTGLFAAGASVADVGAGAGFPSLPLKIARPDLKVTMLDSLKKRVDFLNETVAVLSLSGIRAVHTRAEDGARTALRESFDIVVARAVADLSVLAEYALPFARVGGFFIAMKGPCPEREAASAAAAIKAVGGRLREIRSVALGDDGPVHSLCVIEKIEKTPSKYPRKAGKPAKEPIR